MPSTRPTENPPLLRLTAQTAAELMTANPVSVSADATVEEAVAFLIDRGFSAAPVIDNAGRPIGVLSRADILVHDREKVDYLHPRHGEAPGRTARAAEEAVPVAKGEHVRVRDLMTPVVFSVQPDCSAVRVVEDMTAWKVHRIFVVDSTGVLVGVISALDVLRHLS